MEAMGISDFWKKKYFIEAKECNAPSKAPRLRGLYLVEFATTFLLLVVGCGISLIAFVIELLHSLLLKQRH